MQGGAGVGHKTSGARTPSVQRGPSVPATLPILNGFEQDSASIHRCFLAFLPGSGLRVECDVTYSKQTTAPFLPGARTARSHARSSVATALSNRELELLEPHLIHRKQTIAPRSNRELSTNRCRVNSRAVIPVPTFLTETRSHSEFIVTHSKQTTAPFLTGSRIVTKPLGSGIVFHSVSSEHLPTDRRISLQDGIAQPRLVAASPRMHALVGRA
jgi:hypothetical protein